MSAVLLVLAEFLDDIDRLSPEAHDRWFLKPAAFTDDEPAPWASGFPPTLL
jgi:hypothetical protein